jgi:hypothetical protein
MKQKFPLDHVVKYDTKEIWIACSSATTALGIPALVKKYYPGYTGKIATHEHLDLMRNQLENCP